jgi:energy-coupling factor transport system ATP-binding protein
MHPVARRNLFVGVPLYFMLSIQNLIYHPPATPEPILKGISLELAPQELGLVIGPSGSGKSTLLEILAGFVEWHSGGIHWRSQDLTPDHLQQLCGLVFQFPERHFCGNTVLEELRLGHIDLESDRMNAALQAVGLEQVPLNVSPNSLSGGQQRRLALAVQLLRQPALLLLDEPTAGLDWSMRRQLLKLLEKLKKDWTLLVVSHEPEELKSLAERSWRISHGSVTPLVGNS